MNETYYPINLLIMLDFPFSCTSDDAEQEVYLTHSKHQFIQLFEKPPESILRRQPVAKNRPRWTAKIRPPQESIAPRNINTVRSNRKAAHTIDARIQTLTIHTMENWLLPHEDDCIQLMKQKTQQITKKLRNKQSTYLQGNKFLPTRRKQCNGENLNFSVKMFCYETENNQNYQCSPTPSSPLRHARIELMEKQSKIHHKKQQQLLVPNLTSTIMRTLQKTKKSRFPRSDQEFKKKVSSATCCSSKLISMEKDQIDMGVGYTTKKMSYCQGSPKKDRDGFSVPRICIERKQRI